MVRATQAPRPQGVEADIGRDSNIGFSRGSTVGSSIGWLSLRLLVLRFLLFLLLFNSGLRLHWRRRRRLLLFLLGGRKRWWNVSSIRQRTKRQVQGRQLEAIGSRCWLRRAYSVGGFVHGHGEDIGGIRTELEQGELRSGVRRYWNYGFRIWKLLVASSQMETNGFNPIYLIGVEMRERTYIIDQNAK